MERFSVGRCRSGKVITSHPDFDNLTTYEEVFDAYAVLSVVALRETRRDPSGLSAVHFQNEVEMLVQILDRSGTFSELMAAIGAITAFDLRNHAMRLINPEFKE